MSRELLCHFKTACIILVKQGNVNHENGQTSCEKKFGCQNVDMVLKICVCSKNQTSV